MNSSESDAVGGGSGRLRRKAEKLLGEELESKPAMPTGDVQELVHELGGDQVELEIQNEEVRQAQVEWAHARDRYEDLYEFAPVGYLTIDDDGLICEANLAVLTMLGVERQALMGTPFSKFLASRFKDVWHFYRREIFEKDEKYSCDLKLQSEDGEVRSVRVDGRAYEFAGARRIRVAMLDITAQMEAQWGFNKLKASAGERLADRSVKSSQAIERLRLMSQAVGHLREGVMISDAQLELPGPKIVFVNKAMCDMTGYRKEEILGKTPRMFQGEGTKCSELERIRLELAAGRPASAELINYGKAGNPYHTEIFISPVFGEEGRPTHFISIHRDITDRKKVEDALRRSEERFRRIFKNSPVGIAIRNQEGYFEHCNRAFCELLGYSEEDLRRLHFASLIHPDDRDLNLEKNRLLQAGEITSFEIEIRYLQRDGCLAWVNKFVSLLDDGPGEGGHVISLVSDVTDRRQVMQELRNREERLGAIMNATPDAIITADHEGRIVAVNPAARKVFAYSEEEMIGMQVDLLLPASQMGEEGGFRMGEMKGKNETLLSVSMEVIGRRRDHTVFPVELTVRRVDHLDLFTGVIRDATQRKSLEEEVVNASDYERLTIANDLHDDLGSLLTGVKLGIESLSRKLGQQDLEAAELAEVLALQVSDAMVKVRGIAAGLRPIGSDPEDLMVALRTLVRRMEEASGMEIRLECPLPVLIEEQVMANHLFRIAQEAVSNAVRHSGGSRIVITFGSTDDGIRLAVEDNGTGIDTAGGQPSGLGLHTMKYRARALKGLLRVGAGSAGGTRVVCFIPAPARA